MQHKFDPILPPALIVGIA